MKRVQHDRNSVTEFRMSAIDRKLNAPRGWLSILKSEKEIKFLKIDFLL